MIVDPLKVSLLWGWFTLVALVVWLSVRALARVRFGKWNPRHQWKIFGAVSALVLLPGTVCLELFRPIDGIYSAPAAAYWIERAASESDRAAKVPHVARVALSSEYGSAIAKNAIDRVGLARERCILRTILAELPSVRARLERQAEAQQECATARKT